MGNPSGYSFSAWIFLRALCLVYVIAFSSLAVQARGLWGSEGVLPISGFLRAVEGVTSAKRYIQLPSLFWLGSSDSAIVGWAIIGVLAALLAFVGLAPGWMLLLCYLIYLAYTTTGQEFMSFQWDSLLLETGFLALLLTPWHLGWRPWEAPEPSWVARGLVWFLVFKLMFLSGVAKLQSGDPSWRNLTALTYHFWTQPLPNVLSAVMNALPVWVLRVCTFMTFAVELVCPFLILHPRTRIVAFAGFTSLSLLILLTGNYTFFNYLTLALCLFLLPNHVWSRFGLTLNELAPSAHPMVTVIAAALFVLNLFWCCRWFLPSTVATVFSPAVRWAQTFYISNSYGLFASMTKSRPEIVIEGSDDGQTWKEYAFKYKPGPVNRRPPWVAPHQPRLDWQMWFAALGTIRENPWVYNLFVRLFEGSEPVLGFFVVNPFAGHPPKYLRALVYDYHMAPLGEIWRTGTWWTRELKGDYTPVVQRSSPSRGL